MAYRTEDNSAASAARCVQPRRSVPLIVSLPAGGVTSGGGGDDLLHAAASRAMAEAIAHRWLGQIRSIALRLSACEDAVQSRSRCVSRVWSPKSCTHS